jgi:hypothetical protein
MGTADEDKLKWWVLKSGKLLILSKTHTITWGVSWYSDSLSRAKVISQWSRCSKTVTKCVQLIGVNVCSQKQKWPNNPSRTHSTPHTNLNYVQARRKTRQTVIPIVYKSSEFKSNVTARQRLRGLFIHHTLHNEPNSQNAVTHDDLCCRRSSYMYVGNSISYKSKLRPTFLN